MATRLLRVGLSTLPRGRARLARGLSRLWRRPFVDVVEPRSLGISLIIDPADRYQMEIWAGAYQPHVVSFLSSAVRRGHRVLCAGLHVGYVASVARRLAGPTGMVLSAEPDPAARLRAEENLGLSEEGRAAPVVVFPGAFSDTHGQSVLHRSAVLGHSSLAGRHDAVADVTVDLTTGDDWLRSLGVNTLDIMVLDVEGWETHVLRGLAATVDASPTLCAMVEIAPWALACAGSDTTAVIEFWRSRGYEVRWATRYGPSYPLGVWGPPVEDVTVPLATDVLCFSAIWKFAGAH